MKIISKVLIFIGISFVLSSLILITLNYSDEIKAEKESEVILESIEKVQKDENKTSDVKSVEVDGNNYIATITISSLNLKLPINENYSYDNLKKSPCLYYGSLNTKNFVICAHAYDIHFKNIDQLSNGDIIIITDINNNSYHYQVELVEEMNPTDIDEMLNSDFDLTLFTCSDSGLTRITVRCNEIDS